MLFNPNITKLAQEVFFSRKKPRKSHPSLDFDNTRIQRQSAQKYLGLFSEEKLWFLEHINAKISKTEFNLTCKLNVLFSRLSLLKVYSFVIKPHVDYGDIG